MKNFIQFLNEADNDVEHCYLLIGGVGSNAPTSKLELPKNKAKSANMLKLLTKYFREIIEATPVMYKADTGTGRIGNPIAYGLIYDNLRVVFNFNLTIVTNLAKVFKLTDFRDLRELDDALKEELKYLPEDVQKKVNTNKILWWMDIATAYGSKSKNGNLWFYEFSKDGDKSAQRLKSLFDSGSVEWKGSVSIGNTTLEDKAFNFYGKNASKEKMYEQLMACFRQTVCQSEKLYTAKTGSKEKPITYKLVNGWGQEIVLEMDLRVSTQPENKDHYLSECGSLKDFDKELAKVFERTMPYRIKDKYDVSKQFGWMLGLTWPYNDNDGMGCFNWCFQLCCSFD